MYRIPTSGRFSSSSDESLIARLSQNSLQESSSFSSFQTQVDQIVSHFSRDLASPQSCIPLVAGGLAYRLGRVSFLAAGSQSLSRIPLQMFSVGFGFASEIMAYETSHRIIETISHPEHASGLWDWSGSRGWAQGLAQSALTFSILKGVGHQVQGQNILIQHTAQSTAMVAGHQVAAALHLIPNPQGTLIQQLLDAERTNLQLGLSMALVHRLAPSLLSLERQLDLILRSHSRNSILFHPQLFEAMPAYALESSGPTTTRESLRAPLENYVFMANVAISEPPSSPTSSTRPVGEFLSARPTGRTSFPPRRPSRPGFEAVRPPSDISRLQALKDEFEGFDFGTVEDPSVQNLSIDREAHLRWIELNNKGQRSEVLPLGEVD
ncbi:MAG: hypothetical protein JNK65_08825, partial [Deltaproteobacteria bacterium]|nr:hypothetical protein [Deltaproteobacteria bacterium]